MDRAEHSKPMGTGVARDPADTGPLSDAARALLAWYAAMGVDEFVAGTPSDWGQLTLRARTQPATSA